MIYYDTNSKLLRQINVDIESPRGIMIDKIYK
jgi:hypothetical protein